MNNKLEKITKEIINRAITIHNLGNQASDNINKEFNIPYLLEVLNEYNITKIGFDSFHRTFAVEFGSGIKILMEIPKKEIDFEQNVEDLWETHPDEMLLADIDIFMKAMEEIGKNE